MDHFQVSIDMEPEKDSQGRDVFKWHLIRYEKKRGYAYNYSSTIQKQGSAFSREAALNEGKVAYDNIRAELSKLSEVELSIKNMFFTKNFEGLRALVCDPDKTTQLSFNALLCVVLAVAFNGKAYQETEKLLNRLTQLFRAHGKIDAETKAIIIDERLASSTNVTALHKLAQTCSLLSMLIVDKASPELVSIFKESALVWRQRAVKPPVRTGKMLATRAYDLMELGEKDKAEKAVMMALSKGIRGDLLIAAGNVLRQVGQYKLAEDTYLKVIDDIKNEDLKEMVQEYLNEVREKRELISQAAATQTNE